MKLNRVERIGASSNSGQPGRILYRDARSGDRTEGACDFSVATNALPSNVQLEDCRLFGMRRYEDT